MHKATMENCKTYFWILTGSFFLGIGLRLFLVPLKISPGGVSTISTVFYYLFRIPLSITTLLTNGLLFLFGYKFLGKSGILKTAAGVLFSSLFLAIFEPFSYQFDDMWIGTFIGGALIGTGVGLAVRQEASTGGSDFAALILHRFFPHISVSHIILLIDCTIILVAGLVFKSMTVLFYSAVSLFVSMKATDAVLSFGDAAKSVFILSGEAIAISTEVQKRFHRGTTGIYSRGMYAEKDSLMLLCIVRPKELPALIHLVRDIDKRAFVIVSDAREVLGEGFQSGTRYDSIKKPSR